VGKAGSEFEDSLTYTKVNTENTSQGKDLSDGSV